MTVLVGILASVASGAFLLAIVAVLVLFIRALLRLGSGR